MANGNLLGLDAKLEELDGYDFNEMYADDKIRRMIIDLQRHWLTDYHHAREKALVDLTNKLHEEFTLDQQAIRIELLNQFKQELAQTKAEIEAEHEDNLRLEVEKLKEKQKKEMIASKKKQWCWHCEKEAIYHCCWNTAYCSVECQQGHWQNHRKFCRRKKSGSGHAQLQAAHNQHQLPSSTQ